MLDSMAEEAKLNLLFAKIVNDGEQSLGKPEEAWMIRGWTTQEGTDPSWDCRVM